MSTAQLIKLGDKVALTTFADGVMGIKKEISLVDEYQRSEESAEAVSLRLFLANELETLLDLWEKFGKPAKFTLLEDETGVDRVALMRDIIENERALREAKDGVQESIGRLKEVLDLIDAQEKKFGLMKRSVKVFGGDKRNYLAKR